MCPPVLAVASAVTSIAGAAAGFAGASAQAKAQNEAYQQNALAAQKATRDQYEALNIRRNQANTGADQNAFDLSVEALQKRSTAMVAAGEAGVGGLSVDALVGSLFAQEGRRYERLNEQYAAEQSNITADEKTAQSQGQARINSVQQAAKPSPLPYIIQGVGGAVSAFSKLSVPGSGTV